MKWRVFPKSPVFAAGHRWQFTKRKDGYESDATALVRAMLQDESVRADQALAWERWRDDETQLRKPS